MIRKDVLFFFFFVTRAIGRITHARQGCPALGSLAVQRVAVSLRHSWHTMEQPLPQLSSFQIMKQ